MTVPPILSAELISKAFGATRALRDVRLSLLPGRVHALAGANGSGKSTLIKILSGVQPADSGTLGLDGVARSWSSPKEARAAGIGVVHQEAPLVDTLTVADCVALLSGYQDAHPLRLGRRSLIARAQRLLDEHEVPVSATATCAELDPAERAMVSLAVATDQGSRVLILDEVTASLRQDDAEQVLSLVRKLAGRGTAVLMVTHRLGEITQYADDLTVLAAGALEYHGTAAGITAERIVELMLPDRAEDSGPRHAPARRGTGAAGSVAMTVRGLTGQRLAPLDLEIRGGEILGVTGLPDSGVDELPYLLAGGLPTRGGTVRVGDSPAPRSWNATAARAGGVALLPRDRLSHGGIAGLSVTDNIALPNLRGYWHRAGALRAAVAKVIADLGVRPSDPSLALGSLSGGNQQKVLLGKWLSTSPAVLILDEPTNGVDPAARLTMFEEIRARVAAGMAAVLFSSEFEQLTTYCDRVMVLRPDGPAEHLPVPDNPVHLARIVASPRKAEPA